MSDTGTNVFELKARYEELLDEDHEIVEEMDLLESDIDDLAIPESSGGAGGTVASSQRRNKLVERYNSLGESLRRVRAERKDVLGQMGEFED